MGYFDDALQRVIRHLRSIYGDDEVKNILKALDKSCNFGNLPQTFSFLIELISFMAKDLQVLQNKIAQYRELWNDNDKEFNDSISHNCSEGENITCALNSIIQNLKDSRSKIDLMPLSMNKEVLKHFTNHELLDNYEKLTL